MLQSEILTPNACHFPQKGPHSDRLWPEKQVFHIEGNCERPQGEGRGRWQCPQSFWHSGRAGPASHSQERLQINPELKGVSLRYVQEGAATIDHCRYGLDGLEKGGTKVGHTMPSPSPHSSGVLIG